MGKEIFRQGLEGSGVSEEIIQKKTANYFIPVDQAIIPDISYFSGDGGQKIFSNYVKKNGLWIGGAVYLSSSSIFFKANALNAALNANNPLAASIPLNDIKLLNFKKAIGTSIISVLSETDSLVFRCFGAKNFLLRISEMVPKVKVVS